jgi:glycosyltransferase involved in cell wall biosynthesis
MKILYIITQGENGGAQKNVYDTVTNLVNFEHKIYVATGAQISSKDTWLFDKLKKENVKQENLHVFKNLIRNINFTSDFRAFIEIYKYIKLNKFEIVHLHSTKAGIIGGLAAKFAGAKVVYTVHGFVFTEPMNVLKKLFYILTEFINSFFIDIYICVSKKDLEIGKKYKIIRGNKGKVIYNGINVNNAFLSKVEAREKIINLSKINFTPSKIVGSIANLYRTKGLEYMIDAAKELVKSDPNLLFVIFGEGELRAELEQRIKDLNLKNNFMLLGFVDNAQQYISGFDLFVLSSVKEGLPYTLIEASLTGLPILATSVGGIPEMADLLDINLVNAKSSDSLALEIELILKGDRLQKSKFNNIFKMKSMIMSINEVYKSL